MTGYSFYEVRKGAWLNKGLYRRAEAVDNFVERLNMLVAKYSAVSVHLGVTSNGIQQEFFAESLYFSEGKIPLTWNFTRHGGMVPAKLSHREKFNKAVGTLSNFTDLIMVNDKIAQGAAVFQLGDVDIVRALSNPDGTAPQVKDAILLDEARCNVLLEGATEIQKEHFEGRHREVVWDLGFYEAGFVGSRESPEAHRIFYYFNSNGDIPMMKSANSVFGSSPYNRSKRLFRAVKDMLQTLNPGA